MAAGLATFDHKLPTLKDHVRLKVGDTDEGTAILSDDTIEANLAAYSYSAAVGACADAILAVYAQEPDRIREQLGGEVEFKSRTKFLERLSDRGAAGSIPEPGVSTEEADTATSFSVRNKAVW